MKSKKIGRTRASVKDSSSLMPILSFAELKNNYEYSETLKIISDNKYGSKILLSHNLHNTNLKVIIKIIKKSEMRTLGTIDQVKQAYYKLSKLDHPSIVKFYQIY